MKHIKESKSFKKAKEYAKQIYSDAYNDKVFQPEVMQTIIDFEAGYKAGQNNDLEKKQSIIWLIIGRTLGFTFFAGIAFVGALIMFLKWIVNYIRFGGESIAYTRKTDRKTIHDIYIELIKKQNDEQKM